MKFLENTIRSSIMLTFMLCVSTSNTYAVTDPVSINFGGMLAGQPYGAAAYYGKANIPATDPQGCTGIGVKCYVEQGFWIGTVFEPISSGAHLHRDGNNTSNVALEYHADSGGIYIRAADLSAFSLNSVWFDTRYSDNNPNIGYYEVLGFKDALNPNLTTWDWVADPTFGGKRIAYTTVLNTNESREVLIDDKYNFNNVKAVWIHYVDHPRVPAPDDDVAFTVLLRKIDIGAPIYICP